MNFSYPEKIIITRAGVIIRMITDVTAVARVVIIHNMPNTTVMVLL